MNSIFENVATISYLIQKEIKGNSIRTLLVYHLAYVSCVCSGICAMRIVFACIELVKRLTYLDVTWTVMA
jgi:hypothetical protein